MIYSEKIIEEFDRIKAEIGDRIIINHKNRTYEGMIMPRTGESDILVVKLDSGYNVGFKISDIEIELSKTETPKKIQDQVDLNSGNYHKHLEVKPDLSKKTIAILSTGGTIASKIDYVKGGVKPTFNSEEIITMIPEIASLANVKGRLIQNIFSEDMLFSDYTNIAEEIEKEIQDGIDGIIITHGTDTLHYTAAALSFAFKSSSVPIILVGSQRSSDRGSSDGPFNLLCAANFIVNSDFGGVAVCMHKDSNDDGCLIIEGTRSRKMHTSRRDAFHSINVKPIAFSSPSKVEFYRNDYQRKSDLDLHPEFEKNVGLVKVHPGIDSETFEKYIEKRKGIVIEGTGLGHTPESILNVLKEYIKLGGTAVMSSQCINGRVNLNVYTRGRDLLEMGVLPAEDMTPETALIKLSWLLANSDDVRGDFVKNLRGEISDRSSI